MIVLVPTEGSVYAVEEKSNGMIRGLGYAFKFTGHWYMSDPFDNLEKFNKVSELQAFALESALEKKNERGHKQMIGVITDDPEDDDVMEEPEINKVILCFMQ